MGTRCSRVALGRVCGAAVVLFITQGLDGVKVGRANCGQNAGHDGDQERAAHDPTNRERFDDRGDFVEIVDRGIEHFLIGKVLEPIANRVEVPHKQQPSNKPIPEPTIPKESP